MATPFENFVNTELPKRIGTNESPITPQAGDIPVFTGVGLLTESKTASEAGLATETFATNAANTAETNAKSYADNFITSIYKFQTTYNPQTTGNFPTTANTVGGVAIKKGFTWVVSGVTGQYTFQGVTVNNGDTLLALVDNASATSAADWHITEVNLGYTPENQNNKDTDGTLADNSDTKYPSQKAVKTYADTKQAALADVITADTYGSSTQWPAITFNAKGIATGVTLQTVPTPTFTDATFAVQKNGSPSIAATWDLTAFTESHTHTYPNKAIDFGTMSSVASTNNNTLSGTRNRILGGSGNTVSGTDNIAIGTTDFMLSSDSQVAIGAGYRSVNGIERVTCADTLILGNIQGYALTVVHRLRANGNSVFAADSFNNQSSITLGLTNTPKAVLKRSYFLNARHELTFTASVYSTPGVKAGTISGVRVFGVHYGVGSITDNIGDYVVTSITPYADLVNGNCSVVITASIVEVSVTKEKLLSVHIQAKNAAGTADYICSSTAELVSHYRLF